MSSLEKPNQKLSVQELKESLAQHLSAAHQLKQPEGLATGVESIDRFLFWGGLPKGALTLFRGALGTGTTSLWIEAATRTIAQGRWVAWIDGYVPLSPLSLYHKGIDLSRFVVIQVPASTADHRQQKIFWLLQELMASSLFDLIGCDLGSMNLREHQVRKLQAQARTSQVALVLLSQLRSDSPQQSSRNSWRGSLSSVFSLIVNFESRRILIERALHRPVPHTFSRSVNYARFTLHTKDRIGLGSHALATPNGQDGESYSLFTA